MISKATLVPPCGYVPSKCNLFTNDLENKDDLCVGVICTLFHSFKQSILVTHCMLVDVYVHAEPF